MKPRRNTRHTLLLAGLAVGMFGFAFALVPLYNVICEVTGLNGRTAAQAALAEEVAAALAPDDGAAGPEITREIRIGLLAKTARGMPWEFRPLDDTLVVQPGKMHTTKFYVRNRSHKSVTGQAVPSVAPGQAALYLKKIECFCFEEQELGPGGDMEMGVSFTVDADLPADIHEVTLSYTMFNVTSDTMSDETAAAVDHTAGHHE